VESPLSSPTKIQINILVILKEVIDGQVVNAILNENEKK